jgi:DNA-binding NarL/FixJ family response regulator
VNKIIIASTQRDHMRSWLEVLSSQYSLTFIDNVDMIFTEQQYYDENLLLVLDAKLVNRTNQLPLICRHIKKVIVVGENFTPSQQIQFIYDGASGYSKKLVDRKLITRTIEGVLNDEIWLKREYIPQMLRGVVAKQSFSAKQEQSENEVFKTISVLTEREIEVAEHVYSGKDNLHVCFYCTGRNI